MKIDFSKIGHKFIKKPLLIGGKAMEYYGLRKSGYDIDFVACKQDIEALAQMYPQCLKDLWGDFGVAVHKFEIWKTVNYLDYDELKEGAIEENDFYVISLDKLLYQKAMVMNKPKYLKDLEMVVQKLQSIQAKKYEAVKEENQKITSSLSDINYVEKRGVES